MKKYFKIAKRNVTTIKPYQEITKAEFEDCVLYSDYMSKQFEYIPDDLLEKLHDETIEKAFEKAYNEAAETGFDCGDCHIYISENEDICEYDYCRK